MLIDHGTLIWLLAFLNPRQMEVWQKDVLPALLGLAAIGAMYGVLFLILRWARASEEKRTREIQAALSGSAFTLREDLVVLYLELLKRFQLGWGKNGTLLRNRFEAPPTEGRSMQVLDFAYSSGGKHPHSVWQTIAHIGHKDWHFPKFALTPHVLFQFKKGDINFETHPNFSRLFKLQGEDEAVIRALFTPAALEALERHPGISVEGSGNNLIIYRARKRVKPAEFPQFQEDTRKLAALFVQPLKSSA